MNRTHWIIAISLSFLMIVLGVFIGSLYTERSVAESKTENTETSLSKNDGVVGVKHVIAISPENGRFGLSILNPGSDPWAVGIKRFKNTDQNKLELAAITWKEDDFLGKVPTTTEGIDKNSLDLVAGSARLTKLPNDFYGSIAGYISLSSEITLKIHVNGNIYEVKPSENDQLIVNGETIPQQIEGMHTVFGKLSTAQQVRSASEKGDSLEIVKTGGAK